MTDAFAPLFVFLVSSARQSEEGPKEGKRKRSHSFQVTEAEATNELFRVGELCQSRQTPIVYVSPKDGGVGGAFEHARTMRRWKGVTWGRVGEKFEFLQSYVTLAEVLTKKHFDGRNMV